jgi:DNA (cytosine-5)-methyltransferase 1
MNKRSDTWKVLDLFSGAGGMSYGFHAHPGFEVVGGVDAQLAKPSSKRGALQCNRSFEENIEAPALDLDLGRVGPDEVISSLDCNLEPGDLTVLIACAPCTGFSRTKPSNHLEDDDKNGLVTRSAFFARYLKPDIFLMENARELINGQFSHHFKRLRRVLEESGYRVHGSIHMLDKFGLPQIRERALVIAVRGEISLRSMKDLWHGYRVREEATHVRRAIGDLPPIEAGEAHPDDPMHTAPGFSKTGSVRRRIELIPEDGGSWTDIIDHPAADEILTAAMKRRAKNGNLGDHPDIYGRMAWDQPAPTIKRECAHVGNGRYAHPEQDRLCTLREMSLLQGFPADFEFVASGLSNKYRHVGDAVPPLISHQIAHLCEWSLTGRKPGIEEVILPNTSLRPDDIEADQSADQLELEMGSVASYG